jgi:hypothetical protein
MKISTIKLNDNVQIGESSYVMSYINQGSIIDAFKMTISLDADPRFILLTGKHVDKDLTSYQLIPLTSVSTILLKDNTRGEPVLTPAAKK